jgi:hypothetical protein
MGGACTAIEGEAYTGFWWGNLKEREPLGDPDVDGDNIKVDLQEMGYGIWSGSSWLKVGTGGGHL